MLEAIALTWYHALVDGTIVLSGWGANLLQLIAANSKLLLVYCAANNNWGPKTKKSASELRHAVKRSDKLFRKVGDILDMSTSREVFDGDLESWFVELKDIMFTAIDLMEEFKYTFETNINSTDEVKAEVIDHMANRLLEFIDTTNLNLTENEYLLEALKASKFLNMSIKETSRFPLDHVVFGREVEKAGLLQTVDTNSQNKKLSIIVILGMTGIGKTTLARYVINDSVIKNSFQKRIWVSLHSVFDVRGVIQMIMESVTGQTCNISSLTKLQEVLRKSLKKTKFFMVLDGARSEDKEDWESLLSPLRDAYQGSVVLVTTQSPLVASTLATTQTLRLQHLSDQHCGSIFWKYACKDEQQTDQQLLDIGKIIIGKCGGMPSVAKTLGDILSVNKDTPEWQYVLESDISALQDGKTEIFSALKLSYCDLPWFLKECCSYCVVFPKHHKFEKRMLIQLWIVEDILKTKGGVWMEDLGDQYFDELVERCFFQQMPSNSDGTTLYQLNQLMYDMVQLVAGGPFLAVIDEGTPQGPQLDKNIVRYLSVVYHEGGLEWFKDFKNLKSFMLLTGGSSIEVLPDELLKELTWIRVLDLRKSRIQVLPKSIKLLKLLRYLNLSETPICKLCTEMCSLSMLQILDIRKCISLLQLPKELGNLFNLRHLDMDEHNRLDFPPKIRNMIMLQELKKFTVSQVDGKKITELQNLQALHGELHIMRLDNVLTADEACKANLKDKEFLSSLVLEWSIRPRVSEDERECKLEENILEQLKPHHNLQKLDIMHCRVDKTPNWVWDSPSRLEHVTLAGCSNLKCIQTLKCLQFLKTLKLIGNEVVEEVDRSFFGLGDSADTDFCSLETLELDRWNKVKSWIGVYENDLKRLIRITIRNCPGLEIVPDFNGFRSLRELVFNTCENLNFSQGRRPESIQRLDYGGCTKLVNSQNNEWWPFVLLHGNEIN